MFVCKCICLLSLFINLQAILKEAQKLNIKLAHEYKELQQDLMIARQDAACLFFKKKRAKDSSHNHKQVKVTDL